MIDRKIDWNEALEYCEALGTELAMPHDPAEFVDLLNVIKDLGLLYVCNRPIISGQKSHIIYIINSKRIPVQRICQKPVLTFSC